MTTTSLPTTASPPVPTIALEAGVAAAPASHHGGGAQGWAVAAGIAVLSMAVIGGAGWLGGRLGPR